MTMAFYVFAIVAVAATILTITRLNAMHALLYLIASLLAVAGVFFTLGAPFAAALEVIVYAGAIMVLFVYAVMMLNLGEVTLAEERRWLWPQLWIGPAILCGILLIELLYVLTVADIGPPPGIEVGPAAVAERLFGPYLLAVELASMLLLAGLVAAYRLGRLLEVRRAAETPAPDSRAAPSDDAEERERGRAVQA